MSKASVVKLRSGEDIIGIVTHNTDGTTIHVKDVVQLIATSQDSMGFMPWCPYADWKNGVTLEKSNTTFILPLDGPIQEEYDRVFSKIVVPKGTGNLKLVSP